MSILARRRFFSVLAAGMTALVISPATTSARLAPISNPPLDICGSHHGTYTPQK